MNHMCKILYERTLFILNHIRLLFHEGLCIMLKDVQLASQLVCVCFLGSFEFISAHVLS